MWINCSRTSDPWRRWFAETRMFARTASCTRASGSCLSSVASKASTDGRTRSTIERRFRDWLSRQHRDAETGPGKPSPDRLRDDFGRQAVADDELTRGQPQRRLDPAPGMLRGTMAETSRDAETSNGF